MVHATLLIYPHSPKDLGIPTIDGNITYEREDNGKYVAYLKPGTSNSLLEQLGCTGMVINDKYVRPARIIEFIIEGYKLEILMNNNLSNFVEGKVFNYRDISS